MAGAAFPALRLVFLPIAGLVTASCGSAATPLQAGLPPERDSLYLGLTAQEEETAKNAVQQALETRPSQESLDWESPSGASGKVTPLRTFRITTGHFCRDYREVVFRDDVSAAAVRRACRSEDDIWRQVPRRPAE